MSSDEREPPQPREDDVLRRMLNTPPRPHVPKKTTKRKKAKKPAK